ncbi:MAG: cell division protein ZapA [Deltaproteobacteria bacterium]|nr:MAG: cell division protein ZapA [Deltaproteobacteria bacterium]
MAKRSVEVYIYGQKYVIRSESSEEYVREVASLVDRKMREVAQRGRSVSTLNVAVLAALNIADELLKSSRDNEELLKRIKDQTERLDTILGSDAK